jgi:hypothetical protein
MKRSACSVNPRKLKSMLNPTSGRKSTLWQRGSEIHVSMEKKLAKLSPVIFEEPMRLEPQLDTIPPLEWSVLQWSWRG